MIKNKIGQFATYIKYFLREYWFKPKKKTTVHKVRESPESAQLILKLEIIDKWSLNGGTSNQHDDGLIWFFSQQMLKQHLAQNTSKGKIIILLQSISKWILPEAHLMKIFQEPGTLWKWNLKYKDIFTLFHQLTRLKSSPKMR